MSPLTPVVTLGDFYFLTLLLAPAPPRPLRAPALSDNALVRLMVRVGAVVVLDGLVEGLGGRSPEMTVGKRSEA